MERVAIIPGMFHMTSS